MYKYSWTGGYAHMYEFIGIGAYIQIFMYTQIKCIYAFGYYLFKYIWLFIYVHILTFRRSKVCLHLLLQEAAFPLLEGQESILIFDAKRVFLPLEEKRVCSHLWMAKNTVLPIVAKCAQGHRCITIFCCKRYILLL